MILLIALFAINTVAFPVKSECISKENILAGSSPSGASTVFDWTESIVADFNSQSTIVL